MKKTFVEPDVTVIQLSETDVICTSGTGCLTSDETSSVGD